MPTISENGSGRRFSTDEQRESGAQSRTGAATGAPTVVASTPPQEMPSMPAPPDVGGSVGNVPGGVDVRNENAPQIDDLRSRIDSLRNRISQLQQRPTQQTLEQCRQESEQLRSRAEQAVQTAYRLGIARVLRAIRQNS